MAPKLWRGCTTYPEVLQTARDASKATAEVACGCELCFDRLPRTIGSAGVAGPEGEPPMPSVTSNCWVCPYGGPPKIMPRWINGTSAVRIVVSLPPRMAAV